MLVIFGSNDHVEEEHEQRFVLHCHNCNNDSRWKLSKVISKISLFFIPLIPYKTKYYSWCPVCKDGFEIDENEYQKRIKS